MRRTIALLTGLLLVASLAACGGDDKSASKDKSDNTDQTDTSSANSKAGKSDSSDKSSSKTSGGSGDVCDTILALSDTGDENSDPAALGTLADALRDATPPAGEESQFSDWIDALDKGSQESASELATDFTTSAEIASGFLQFGLSCVGAGLSDSFSDLSNFSDFSDLSSLSDLGNLSDFSDLSSLGN